MPSCSFTSGGSLPPSCIYLCTTSRPVKRIPEIRTSSRTFSAQIFSFENGAFSSIISVEPGLNFAVGVEDGALAAIGPAHVTDADEVRGGQTIGRADFYA